MSRNIVVTDDEHKTLLYALDQNARECKKGAELLRSEAKKLPMNSPRAKELERLAQYFVLEQAKAAALYERLI